MKNSVLMTTYNGEAFILEQLDSIYNQTKKVNEVIICDDCSTDDTVVIVRNFIEQKSLTNWQVIVNKENKGWQKNFIEALSYVHGDVIFYSDQDDIWYPDKIAVMSNVMQRDKNVQCLAGRVHQIDAQGIALGSQEISIVDRIAHTEEISNYKKFNVITFLGCTMCFTRKLADIISEVNATYFGHDAQTCRLAALLGGMYIMESAVLMYRMHENNTSGVVAGLSEGASDLETRKKAIRANIQWLNSIINYSQKHDLLSQEKKIVVRDTIKMQEDRLSFLNNRKFGQYLSLVKYMKYYSGIGMYLGDFAYAYRINAKVAPIMAKMKKK